MDPRHCVVPLFVDIFRCNFQVSSVFYIVGFQEPVDIIFPQNFGAKERDTLSAAFRPQNHISSNILNTVIPSTYNHKKTITVKTNKQTMW